MQRTPATQKSDAYLAALTQEIEKKLQRALNSPTQRLGILQELFADIALGIDVRARDIIFCGDEGTDQEIEQSICFYDVLANHYGREPLKGKGILDLIVKLWSQSYASHIFALLFHRWLFEANLENPESCLRFASALVQGATNVFWYEKAALLLLFVLNRTPEFFWYKKLPLYYLFLIVHQHFLRKSCC